MAMAVREKIQLSRESVVDFPRALAETKITHFAVLRYGIISRIYIENVATPAVYKPHLSFYYRSQ